MGSVNSPRNSSDSSLEPHCAGFCAGHQPWAELGTDLGKVGDPKEQIFTWVWFRFDPDSQQRMNSLRWSAPEFN